MNTFCAVERCPHSMNSTFVVLENASTGISCKTNFLPMKGENSITSLDIQIKENMIANQGNIHVLKHWIYTLNG